MGTQNKTIVYYTASREAPDFEQKICKNIIKQKGDIPVISVSQKPLDFGENICVGDVGHSYLNEFRQLLIGARAAKTPYLVLAESDFLYPEGYFNFETKGGNLYRYSNVWIVYKNPHIYSYRRKPFSIGAQIVKKDYIIHELEIFLEGTPEWYDGEISPRNPDGSLKRGVWTIPFEFFDCGVPCISFKTDGGMRRYTNVLHGKANISAKLAYWGHVRDIRREYFGQ